MKMVKRWLSGLLAGTGTSTTTHPAHGRRARRSPQALTEAAEYAPALKVPMPFETLEQRQLLFQIVVTDDPNHPQFFRPDGTPNPYVIFSPNPVTGVNGVQVLFGYAAPFLAREIPDPVDPNDPVQADFDDLIEFTPLGNRFELTEELVYAGTAGNAFVSFEPPVFPPGDEPDGRSLDITLTAGQVATFALSVAPAEDGDPIIQFRALDAAVAIYANVTLTAPVNWRVELLQVPYHLAEAFLADPATNDPNIVTIQTTFAGPAAAAGFSNQVFTPDPNIVPAYFQVIRYAIDGGTARFRLDSLVTREIASRFGQFNDERIFGVNLRIEGDVGSVVEALDLYGRQMRATLEVGSTEGVPLALIDLDDDGIPDFNDGIGRISFTGNVSFVYMMGGTVALQTEDTDGDGDEAEFEIDITDSLAGLFDEFEAAGFGFRLVPGTFPPEVQGLPPGGGSIIIGAPFFRNNLTQALYFSGPRVVSQGGAVGVPNGNADFTQTPLMNNLLGLPGIPVIKQGISFDQAATTVVIHGMIFGEVNFASSVQTANLGVLLGSLSVNGDAGSLLIAGDSGTWIRDDATGSTDALNSTGSVYTFGRFLGNFVVGGRNQARVLVLGDVNNPTRPALSFLNFSEREQILDFNQVPADQSPDEFIMNSSQGNTGVVSFFMGSGLYRNDSLLSSEYVGTGLRGVVINGSLGAFNLVQTNEDTADFYSFSAARGQRITLNFSVLPGADQAGAASTYARIVDINGRVLAAAQYPPLASADGRIRSGGVRFAFTPTRNDVYYLVVSVQTSGAQGTSLSYTVQMNGQMATSFGQYTSGASTRGTDITVSNGAMGLVRFGAGITPLEGGSNAAGLGTIFDPAALGIFSVEAAQDLLSPNGTTVNSASDLFGIVTGSDIRGLTVNAAGNLGMISTGWVRAAADAPTAGDINALTVRVGGSFAGLETPFGLGYQTNATPAQATGVAGPVVISTGTGGGPGHVGALLVGGIWVGNVFTLTTSANSIIDRIIVGRAGVEGFIGAWQPTLNLGAGSDIRFVNFDRALVGGLGSTPDGNLVREIAYGQTMRLVDDNGTAINIRITGGVNTAAAPNASRVRVRFIPVQGSQGVAIGRIEAALVAGASLTIEGETAGVISIGEIAYATDTGTGGANPQLSGITLRGPAEIDVLSIVTDGGIGGALNVGAAGNNPLGTLRNDTVRGDLVSVDVAGLTNLQIRGDLGRTTTNGVGDSNLAPYLGVVNAAVNQVGGPLGVFGGGINAPAGVTVPLYPDYDAVNASLEDVGAPFDGWLNGLVVRGGGLASVRVDGAVGDVILQDPTGVLGTVTANADNTRVAGVFEGIIGSIFANDIGTVDLGDGLAASGDSPFAAAGIFAVDDIARIVAGTRVRNPVINGAIIAANGTPVDPANPGGEQGPQGLAQVQITNATVDGAFFGGASLDSFWRSMRVTPTAQLEPSDPPQALADVDRVTLTGTTLKRSTIFGRNVNTVTITRGNFDASLIQAQGVVGSPSGQIGTVRADNFLNSTRDGEPLEFKIAAIRASGDLQTLQTNGKTGSMSDLFIDLNGNVDRVIQAYNMIRLVLDVDATINSLKATNDFRSINVTAGRVLSATARSVRSSTFTVAGELRTLTATADIVSSVITSDGPGGAIGTIRAGTSIGGQINSSGPVTSILATKGDITALIRTTDTDAHINAIRAGRDAAISIDALGNIGTITAGRHVGRRDIVSGGANDQIITQGTLASITAAGQLYADVKVGQAITGTIKTGRVVALPNTSTSPSQDRVSDAQIIAYARINAVAITGDFAGTIRAYSGGIGKITLTAGSLRRYAPTVTTVTPTTPIQGIFAHDGNIDSVTVSRGHILGDIAAYNGSIGTISIKGDANFGDIGVDPTKIIDPNNPPPVDQSLAASEGRYRLPALPTGWLSAGRDGPTIFAQYDINTVSTTGRLFEAAIMAGRRIGTVTAAGADNIGAPTATPSFIIGGDLVTTVNINSKDATAVVGLLVNAGITGLGADNLPGGIGANADTVKSGDVTTVNVKGSATGLLVSAGMNAGADGLYNTPDDLAARGLSTVKTVKVSGPVAGTSVFADTSFGTVTPGIATGGTDLGTVAPVFTGAPVGTALTSAGANFFIGAAEVNIKFNGTGAAFFDAVTNPAVPRIILVGTDSKSSIVVTPVSGAPAINDLTLISTDDSSLGTLSFAQAITGNFSGMYLDGTINTAAFSSIAQPPASAGQWEVGQGITTLNLGTAGQANGARFIVPFLGTANVQGDFGDSTLPGGNSNQTRLDAITATAINIGGALGGILSIDRDATRIAVTGAVDKGGIRVGGANTTFTAASLFRARVGFRSGGGTVTIGGGSAESFIVSGVDLGDDAQIGGTGANADFIGNGNLNSVTINGDFTRSDIAAGVLAAQGQFLTTGTDQAAGGRSTIGNVRITGTQVGSNAFSQRYGIVANGAINGVTIGGANFNGTSGNFSTLVYQNQPEHLAVADLRVFEGGGVFTATITFTQGIDFSSLAAALTIQEVRGTSASPVFSAPLVAGVDFFLNYDAKNFVASIEFSRDITDRLLTLNVPGAQDSPQVDGFGDPLPSPGIYQFTLDASLLKGQATDQVLDGNDNGVTGDNYVGYDVVGDAGDRLEAFTGNTNLAEVPFYAPINLDILLGGIQNDGRNPINTTTTIRGKLGDNPHADATNFTAISDLDLYTLTLKPGQIIDLSGLRGLASGADFVFMRLDLLTNAPAPTIAFDGFQQIPTTGSADPNNGATSRFLIEQGGTYAIAITIPGGLIPTALSPFLAGPFPQPIGTADIVNLPGPATSFGTYNFDVRIFDDGDSGFAAPADPADGQPVNPVPVPADFATPTSTIIINSTVGPAFEYVLRVGADGVANTSDDLVFGTNGVGTNSTRDAGLNGLWGDADDRVLLTSDSGDGMDVIQAPRPEDFAGADTKLGTNDDLLYINRQGFRFVLNPGANGVVNGNTNSDDLVVGTDRFGNTLTRTAGADRNFGTLDDLALIGASIGVNNTPGYTPQQLADVDIFNLNADARIPVNSRMRLTLRTTGEGSNLGLLEPSRAGTQGEVATSDLRGLVQFAVFDTSAKSTIGDGRAIIQPDKINYLDGTPNQTVAANGFTRYGYDSQGDFYVEFTVPARLDDPTVAASLALYVQGALQTNYVVEVQNLGSGPAPSVRTQNVLIETRGGEVDWLESGAKTSLQAFDPSTNGFTGRLNGVPVAEYILNSAANPDNLVNQVQAMFDAVPGMAGLVRVSTNPADFAGQLYSTIYVTSTFQPAPFFAKTNFGEVERYDPFNTNPTDEGVVFAPALNLLGNPPSQAGVDSFTRSLSAAVARQIGMLVGLQVGAAQAAVPPVDIMADNSPGQDTGAVGNFQFTAPFRVLAGQGAINSGTQFFLGQASSQVLLRRIFGVG